MTASTRPLPEDRSASESAGPPAPAAPVWSPPEYRLSLDVDFEGMTWAGTLEVDPPPAGPPIAFDAEDLRVTAVRRAGEAVPFVVAGATLTVPLEEGPRGPLTIEFTGAVDRAALVGLYRSRHGSGYVLTTQCEPIGARRIFPCVDRPDRKAVLRLRVRTGADLEVVGNTTAVPRPGPDGGREWTFEPTPPMATYLFYLGVGRFDRSTTRPGRIAIRVLTPPGRGVSGGYAAEAAHRILEACEGYYGIPYPLPKLDLIAIEEHAFGAMENWGAISFQALRVLVDERSASFAPRDVFETISHEIAHQWFGNLVTMAWWSDIWLNESFAALMETKITEAIAPALDARVDFFLRTAGMAAAIDGDSLRSTHPVRAAVERPEQFGQIFDEISYGKGSSVLAMLEAYLGEPRFRAGVNEYLTRYRLGNARTEDLWAVLERTTGEPVSGMAGPWIDRPGFPVVRARSTPDGLELEQARFGYLEVPASAPWPIPMVVDIDGRRERVRFDHRTMRVPAPATASVHLNPGAAGFYRVRYEGALGERLLAELPRRPAPDRWIVLEDLAAFVLSGDTDWATYARFVRALGSTTDRLVVESVAGTLTAFALALPGASAAGDLAREFLAGRYADLGPSKRAGEPAAHGVLRERVSFGRVRVDADFAREIAPQFERWGETDPDLRAAVVLARVRAGGSDGFRAVRAAFDRGPSEIETVQFSQALVWSAEPTLVVQGLDFALTGAVSRGRIPYIVAHAASNPAGTGVTWSWFQRTARTLEGTFRGSGYLSLMLERTIPLFGIGRADEVRAYFAAQAFPDGDRGVAKGLERLEIYERLRRRLAAG